MEKIEPKIIVTEQGPIEFAEWGTGPALVCLHGAMGGWDQSMILGKTINQTGYRHIAVSRPGYLGTPLNSGPKAEEQADLLVAFFKELSLKDITIIAISGGGPCAVQLVVKYPELCRKLILVSTVGQPLKEKVPFSFKVMTGLAGIKPVVSYLKKQTESNLKKALSRSISDPVILDQTFKNSEVMELFKGILTGVFDQMKERIPGTQNDIEVSGESSLPLEKISIPTLVIHGDRDQNVPFPDHGKVLSERIPNARLCLLEGGEHVALFTHRAQVVEAITHFLKDEVSI